LSLIGRKVFKLNNKIMKKTLFAAVGAATMLSCCCGGGNKTAMIMGDLSQFDSISYVIGANIGNGMNYQFGIVPFDYEALDKNFRKAALGDSPMSREETRQALQDYFSYQKFGQRSQEIARKRFEADSVRMAAGDSTKVEYGAAPEMFENEQERKKVSEAFGADLGMNIYDADLPLHVCWIVEAMQNVRDKAPKMTEEEVGEYMQYYFLVKRPRLNAEASEAWLEKVGKRSGVQKTESGLLYKVIEAGDPEMMPADPRDVVKVHYTGRLRTGKIFDTSLFKNRTKEQQEELKRQYPDSYDKDEPVSFPLNRVIKGWTEGLQLVGKGGKIQLWIPAALAYGSSDNGRIGPNEALEFEVELIDVEPYQDPDNTTSPIYMKDDEEIAKEQQQE